MTPYTHVSVPGAGAPVPVRFKELGGGAVVFRCTAPSLRQAWPYAQAMMELGGERTHVSAWAAEKSRTGRRAFVSVTIQPNRSHEQNEAARRRRQEAAVSARPAPPPGGKP